MKNGVIGSPLNEFQPWIKPPEISTPPATEEAAFRELRRRYEETSSCWEKAERQLEEAQSRCAELRTKADALAQRAALSETKLDELQATLAKADGQIAVLSGRVESLEAELTLARRPWWKRLFRV